MDLGRGAGKAVLLIDACIAAQHLAPLATSSQCRRMVGQRARMSEQWNTKFGSRRVRTELPTLQEGIIAAQGITSDVNAQVEIAASLLGVAAESIRAEILAKPVKSHNRVDAGKQGAGRTVIVERRSLRRRV